MPAPSRTGAAFAVASAACGFELQGRISEPVRANTGVRAGHAAQCLANGAEHGGRTEGLKVLAQTIRARLTIEDKILALTAQARLQARIMFCLPGFVVGALYLLDATAFEQAWFNSLGVWVAGGIVAMLTMGLWWMQVILRGDE